MSDTYLSQTVIDYNSSHIYGFSLQGDDMPTISIFFGIVVHMYIRGEHNPPHFHAMYGEHEALVDIQRLEVIEGKLPRRALALVLEWANEHRDELMEDWNLCRAKQLPKQIKPLE